MATAFFGCGSCEFEPGGPLPLRRFRDDAECKQTKPKKCKYRTRFYSDHLLLIDCSAGLFFPADLELPLLLWLVDGASAWLITWSEALSDFIWIIMQWNIQTIVRWGHERKKMLCKKKAMYEEKSIKTLGSIISHFFTNLASFLSNFFNQLMVTNNLCTRESLFKG